jgi:hypothetical protein
MSLQTGVFAFALVILLVGVFSAGRQGVAARDRHLYRWCAASAVVGVVGALIWLLSGR